MKTWLELYTENLIFLMAISEKQKHDRAALQGTFIEWLKYLKDGR